MMDPKLRRRSVATAPREEVRRDLSNVELVEECIRRSKLSKKTLRFYRCFCLDAVSYFRDAEGREVPVREWTKAQVWEYVHHVEGSYCSHFRQIAMNGPLRVACKKQVWAGWIDGAQAVQDHCGGCPLFKPALTLKKRLHALDKWFTYLASLELVPFNFVHDIVKEWYAQAPREQDGTERKRNPTRDEMVRLVNGTAHPARRAFYAAGAKWALRSNEMLRLDRYASFGLPLPEGCPRPAGFEEGFTAHPGLKGFAEGGAAVYLPVSVAANGQRAPEKRTTGNRWLVVDAELRPILEQYFAWWERTVKRDPTTGRPLTTRLWLKDSGVAENLNREGGMATDFNERWFYGEAERLGLMKPGDREDPRRRWTGYSQRHFAEQVFQMANVPSDWINHFRGDAFKDSRGAYFKPRPEQVVEKYLALVPRLGFNPLPDAPKLRGSVGRSERETHRAILEAELERLGRLKTSVARASVVRVELWGEAWVVPARMAASLVYVARSADASAVVLVGRSSMGTARVEDMERLVRRVLDLLG